MPTFYTSIGNSDDKLSQREWSAFTVQLVAAIRRRGSVHGIWYSSPNSEYQNACVCFEVDEGPAVEEITVALAQLAETYRQDSIALATAETRFVGAEK